MPIRRINQRQQAELDALRRKHGGLLSPAVVVKFAAGPKTALHCRFTWDDSEAAQQYRLWQARQVLRVVVFMPEGSETSVRAFVSLRDDRNVEGGYRATVDVLSDAGLRRKMLAEALEELQVFERKYRLLSELAPVFKEADRLRARIAKGKPSGNGKAKAKTGRRKATVTV